VREALFNVLDARLDFDGLVVLDLYAGSGALGLEALSRGASRAVFVEQDHRAAGTIGRNITELGMDPAAEVRRASVATVLAGGTDRPADLVLADPPYDVPDDEVHALLAALDGRGWARPGTVVVIERRASGEGLRWPSGWSPWPARRYGDTRLEMAEREPPST
jgi:16S rRNA (guanine(966)-N(2))-methyltransferase RsmD